MSSKVFWILITSSLSESSAGLSSTSARSSLRRLMARSKFLGLARPRRLASEAQIRPYCIRRPMTSSIRGGKARQNLTMEGKIGGISTLLSSEVSTEKIVEKIINVHREVRGEGGGNPYPYPTLDFETNP